MTEQQSIMQREMERVREYLAEAVGGIEADGGDIRFFSAAFLTAAVQLSVEIEGTAGLKKAISKIAQWELVRAGEAGRC
ncbi:hypothetical protein [Sulfitobacter pontiacus]|uniref:hypothetical protein n=1 Tax=Sulfitobacter pontiacus TaxID=60137 RepID=UPI0036DD2F66